MQPVPPHANNSDYCMGLTPSSYSTSCNSPYSDLMSNHTVVFFRFQTSGSLQKHPRCYRSKGIRQRSSENRKNAYFSNRVFSYFVKQNFEVSKVWHTVLTQRHRLHVLYPSETVCIAVWFTPSYKLSEQVHQTLYPLLPPSFHSTIAGKYKSNLHKFSVTLCPHSQQTAQFHQRDLITRHLSWIFDNLTKYGTIQLQKAKPPQHWVDSVHSLWAISSGCPRCEIRKPKIPFI